MNVNSISDFSWRHTQVLFNETFRIDRSFKHGSLLLRRYLPSSTAETTASEETTIKVTMINTIHSFYRLYYLLYFTVIFFIVHLRVCSSPRLFANLTRIWVNYLKKIITEVNIKFKNIIILTCVEPKPPWWTPTDEGPVWFGLRISSSVWRPALARLFCSSVLPFPYLVGSMPVWRDPLGVVCKGFIIIHDSIGSHFKLTFRNFFSIVKQKFQKKLYTKLKTKLTAWLILATQSNS